MIVLKVVLTPYFGYPNPLRGDLGPLEGGRCLPLNPLGTLLNPLNPLGPLVGPYSVGSYKLKKHWIGLLGMSYFLVR